MPSYLLLSLLGLLLLFPLAVVGAAERPRPDRSQGRPDLGAARDGGVLSAAVGAALRGRAARRPHVAAGVAEQRGRLASVMRVPVYRYDAEGRCSVDAWTVHLN